jgi:hypothetical protein
MVVSGGPSIVDEGLVLHLDAGDRACYRGEPTTNLMPHTNGITGRVGWPGGAYTHSIETTGDYAGWQKMVVTSTGSISNFIMRLGDVTCSPGVVYTATIEYYAPYANLKFHISGAHGNYTPVRIGDTNKYYLTFTFGAASAGSMGWWLLTTASTPANTAITNGVIYYRRVQFEQKSYYTDFTIGTRGSTVATGGGLLDLTNNGNDGGINRTSVPSSSFYKSANKGYFSFDGSDDYISLGTNVSDLNFGNQDFAILAWVYRLNTNTANIICGQANLATAAGSSFVFYVSSSSKSDVYIGSTGKGINSPNPAINTWSYIGFVRNGSELLTYLNGSIVDSRSDLGTGSLNVGFTNYPATIGGFASGINMLNGYISNLSVYKNKTVNRENILQNYNATKGKFL